MAYFVSMSDDVHEVVLVELDYSFCVFALDFDYLFIVFFEFDFCSSEFEEGVFCEEYLFFVVDCVYFVVVVGAGGLANVHIDVEYFEVDVLLISFYAVFFEGVAFGAFVLLFVFF